MLNNSHTDKILDYTDSDLNEVMPTGTEDEMPDNALLSVLNENRETKIGSRIFKVGKFYTYYFEEQRRKEVVGIIALFENGTRTQKNNEVILSDYLTVYRITGTANILKSPNERAESTQGHSTSWTLCPMKVTATLLLKYGATAGDCIILAELLLK